MFGNFDDVETRLYTFYKKQMKIIIQICNVARWLITNLQQSYMLYSFYSMCTKLYGILRERREVIEKKQNKKTK